MEADNLNKKVSLLSFLAFAALCALVSGLLLSTFGNMFAIVERWRSLDIVKHGLPIVVGVAVFLSLQFNQKVKIWADEVISEIRKIVWPGQKDTVHTTIVVCVMVVLAGSALAVIDYISGVVIKWIVN